MFAVTGLAAVVWVPAWAYFVGSGTPVNSKLETPLRRVSQKEWRKILTQPVFWAIGGCVFFFSYYWYFVLTWVPTYLMISRKMSTIGMGRALSLPLFLMAVTNVAVGSFADRLASKETVPFGVRSAFLAAGLVASSSILLLLLLPNTIGAQPVLIISICGFGVANVSFWTIAQQVAPAAAVGSTIGVLNTVSQMAGAAAPVITGWSLGPEKNFAFAILLAGASPLLALLLLVIANPAALSRLQREVIQP